MQVAGWRFALRAAILLGLCCLVPAGCWTASENEVIVYTALDQEFSEPILDDFARQTGVVVLPKFDTESTKTVGLAQAIMAERDRPRCDVFWNNEILNTLRLQKQGLLEVYRSPAAQSFPDLARSPRGTWHGFAARARILLINTKLLADVPEHQWPRSIHDLADPRWRGRAAIAKPLFGTTATHAACLFAVWGDEKAKDYFRTLKANGVKIEAGNRQVAQSVAAGQRVFGLTDTDDAVVVRARTPDVAIVYPDQGDDGLGTLFIPNTLAIVKGCRHGAAARRLVDYLLSPEVEARLAAGPSAQIPLNPRVDAELQVETPKTIKAMEVDFDAAVDAWDTAAQFLRDEMTGG